MINSGKNIHGHSQGLPNIFRAPVHRAHRAVIFAIAQFSCLSFSHAIYTLLLKFVVKEYCGILSGGILSGSSAQQLVTLLTSAFVTSSSWSTIHFEGICRLCHLSQKVPTRSVLVLDIRKPDFKPAVEQINL